jgi:orotate phosphoribosyltransferase
LSAKPNHRTTTDPNSKKKQVNFDVLFGPAYKGISLGAVVSSALYAQYGVSVGFAYNRKEAKDHGEGGVLVGADMTNKRVLVVDDVITAGTAIRESHSLLVGPPIQAEVVGVAIALDRAEKRSLDDPVSAVQAVARDLNLPVISIVNLPQLQTFLKTSNNYGEDVLKQVSEYRAQYGVSDD